MVDSYREARVIIERECIRFGVSHADITGKRRFPLVMKAKKAIRKALREETDLSIGEIMILTGASNKHHRI